MVGQVYANTVKQVLVESIDALNANKQQYVLNAEKDFQRERKLPFDTTVRLLLQMENRSLQAELLNYYNHDPDAPTKSAFCQQRKKLRAEAMEALFFSFTRKMMSLDTLKTTAEGYLVLACDGSDINIPYNPDDVETFHQNANKRGYNQLHLNALYDVYNGVYVDVVLKPDRKSHERDAFIKMVDRYDLPYPAIFLSDRGYEGYNVFAHLLSSGQKFVIRLKDPNSNGILSTYEIDELRDEHGEFDCAISTILTHRQTNEIKADRDTYTFVARNHLDYFAETSEFPLDLRVVCVEIGNGVYEYLATNLEEAEFPLGRMKELYHARWGIETSFRDLKYTIDVVHFHGRKLCYVEQEVWARLTVYNFCEAITHHTIVARKSYAKYDIQINFATATNICKAFLRRCDDDEMNVCRLIGRFLCPVRPDRTAKRNLTPKSAKSFLYRAA